MTMKNCLNSEIYLPSYKKLDFKKGSLQQIVVLGAGDAAATAINFANERGVSSVAFIGERQAETLLNNKKFIKSENDIKIGDRFYTPLEYLYKALSTRAAYNPAGLVSDKINS
tara:strand:- start:291 stop:629 length:339 start_codon:yes stop_codon:yes gene_type:complete